MGDTEDTQAIKDFLKNYSQKENKTKTVIPLLPSKEKEESVNMFIPEDKAVKKEIEPENNISNFYYNNKGLYEEIYISTLPLGKLYPEGTRILIRTCSTEEIQNFSSYDDRNPFNFRFKLNEMIESCVWVERADGTPVSYRNIFDADRHFIAYTIREKTFPKGKVYYIPIKYKDDSDEVKTDKIALLRSNLDIYDDKETMSFFNKESGVFEYLTDLRDDPFYLLPPTIGLRHCFDQYIKIKLSDKDADTEKLSPFLTIGPFLKPNITYMSYDDIEEYYNWFTKKMKPDEYLFLYDLINNHLKLGIRGLKKNKGDRILRTAKIYPDRRKDFFIVPNSFKLHIRQSDKT